MERLVSLLLVLPLEDPSLCVLDVFLPPCLLASLVADLCAFLRFSDVTLFCTLLAELSMAMTSLSDGGAAVSSPKGCRGYPMLKSAPCFSLGFVSLSEVALCDSLSVSWEGWCMSWS